MVRSALEQVAARLCAARATPEQRAELSELARKFKRSALDNDVSGCREADTALHSFIVKCSGSRLLTRMLNNSHVITNTIRNVTWLPITVSRPDIHDALVAAIVSGDEQLAEAQAGQHIAELLASLRRAIRDRGLET